MILLVLISSVGAQCPEWSCENLSGTDCAKFNPYTATFQINESPCSVGKTCYIRELYESSYQLQSYTNRTETISWTDTLDELDDEIDLAACDSLDELARIRTGTHPKQCTIQGYADPACELENGVFTLCQCGMDGEMYWNFGSNDPELEGYWDLCGDSATDKAILKYWTYYILYFIEWQTAPDWALATFYELEIIQAGEPEFSVVAILVTFLILI